MQTSNPSFQAPSSGQTPIFGGGTYQDPSNGYQLISLSPWKPTQEDFMDQGTHGGHTCIIAASQGYASVEDLSQPALTGENVGVLVPNVSALGTDIDVCANWFQGQRNIVIVDALGGQRRGGFTFLSGTPGQPQPSRVTVEVVAVNQGTQIDPAVLGVLVTGPYAGLALKPASAPPRAVRLSRPRRQWHGWLATIIHEAEDLVEELIGVAECPFGGGHRVHLRLPPSGLQPLILEVELAPNEPPGTVHVLDIRQTNADGARGGIRVGVIVP